MNTERMHNKITFSYIEIQKKVLELYGKYDYLNLTKEQFESLCKGLISNISEQNGKITSKKCVEILETSLDNYVKNKLNNSKHKNKILKNFINKKIAIHNNYEENLEELRQLNNFLTKYEVEDNPELYSELLNNQIIYTIVEKIVQSKFESIKKIGLDIIDSNHNIQLLLEMYCEINQIDYKQAYIEICQVGYDDDMKAKNLDSLGLYLSQIAKPLLTREEEQRLFELKEQGDAKAREKLIEHNLQLVVHVAKTHTGKGLDILDLIQEGNMGLVNAIERFDYKKGYKLSTYATWWIKQSIQRGIMNTVRPIRIPVHLCEKLAKYGSIKNKLAKELQREPTKEEICKDMKITMKQLIEIEKTSQSIVSINCVIGNEEESDTELGEFLASDDSIEEEYANSSRRDELLHILDRIELSERERTVVILRFGLDNGVPKTLEDVGNIYGITRERARQIEAKALRKIRTSPQILKLASLIDIDVETNNLTKRHYIRSKTI